MSGYLVSYPHVDLEKLDRGAPRGVHTAAREFLSRDPAGELDPRRTRDKLQARGTLPTFHTLAEFEREGKLPLGTYITQCREELVKAAVREGKLMAIIEDLERRVLKLEGMRNDGNA